MVDSKFENGYTRISNEILENILIRDFSGQSVKIIYLCIRLSLGCNCKAWQYSSYKDFEVIGLYKSDIAKLLQYLDENKVLLWDRKYKLISFNMNYDEWTIPVKLLSNIERMKLLVHKSLKNTNEVSNLLTLLEKREQSLKKSNDGVSKALTKVLVKSEQFDTGKPSDERIRDMPKESIKESIKENIIERDGEVKNVINSRDNKPWTISSERTKKFYIDELPDP